MKLLIIRFSSIGDIVLTTPVIRCLKKQLADAEIHFITKPQFKTVLENNPYIDKLIILENWKTTIEKLRREQYDYIIDLHHNLKSLRLKTALYKVPSFSFNKLNIEKWLLTSFKINLLPNKHIVDRYFETLDFFNVKNDGSGLDYFIADKDVVAYTELPLSHLHGFIAIVIGAAHHTKKLPVEKLKQLCSLIDHPVILLGGKEDAVNGNEIAQTDSIKIYNACGKFSLNESADLIKKSKFVITHDTGLMHIAAAFKKPVIAVWGNTVKEFGMYAYYGNDNIENINFAVQHLPCRPCSKIGYKKCPRGHFKCMNMQHIHLIAATAIDFLKHQQLQMKKILLALITLVSFKAESQDTSLNKAAINVCGRLTKSNINENSTQEQMQQVFLSCMVSSAPDLISKIVSSGEDYQKAGQEIGTQLAMQMMKNGCPAFTKIAASMAMSGGDSSVDMSGASIDISAKPQAAESINGTVTKVEERDFLYITVKTTAGRELDFIYYNYVPGSDDWIKDAANKLKNKNVSISYAESEVYQPKFKQFMKVKEVKTLTIK